MKCDIIIPVWNQPEATKFCIEAIEKNTRFTHRLIVVDNGSDDKTKDFLKSLEGKNGTKLIRNEKNLGFIKAINQALEISDAPYVCMMNNDTLPATNWLTELVNFTKRNPDVGLLNPLCSGHTAEGMGINEYAALISSNRGKFMEMNQCQGFCMLVKREVLDKVGKLDERFGLGGFDDTDYSRRAQESGYRSVCVHSSYVYHKEHVSFDKMGDRKAIQKESERLFYEKWPRHKRALATFCISSSTQNEEIKKFLNLILLMARSWVWVNTFIFGENAREKIKLIKKEMNYPLHQSIKFNYLAPHFKAFQLFFRMLERSFGKKRRKKYDVLIDYSGETNPITKLLCRLQGCAISSNPDDATSSKIIQAEYKCDIILPVCDQYEFTKNCIESIIRNTDTPYRIIVINNGKNPDTLRFLKELEKRTDVETTVVSNDQNIGWVKAINKGIKLSNAPYVCFQNDDTILTRGWLRKMINILRSNSTFGIINPEWEGRSAEQTIDSYNSILERKNKGNFMETDWCRGFSAVVKRAVIDKIGGLDEAYGLGYFDDVDYSAAAIEAGFLCIKALDTYVYHEKNVSAINLLGKAKWNELHEKNKLICYKKWGKPLRIITALNRETCKNKKLMDEAEDSIFNLARKRHHIFVWSPVKLKDRFRHTNIKQRRCPWFLQKNVLSICLWLNGKKREEKRYDVILKADTRGELNVEL